MILRFIGKHFWVVHLLFVAAAAWLASYIVLLFVEDRLTSSPKPSLAKSEISKTETKVEPYERYAPITERNIFNPAERGQKLLPLAERRVAGGDVVGGSEAAKIPSLENYSLAGTITGPGPHSWVILQEKGTPKQRLYRVHGDIGDGKIVKISRNRVEIERQGKREILTFTEEDRRSKPMAKQPPSARALPSKGEEVKRLSANRYLINREDVTAAVGNINQFMTQARLKPHFEMGRPVGYSLSEIVPGSLIEKLGLRNQDVIKKVNGLPISRPEEVFQAYSQLQRDSNIEIEIERAGRSEVFRYEIR